ncbi:TonB-dependent receptor [Marinoscillum furvescens]|uniref:TonB-dependent receptor n=1 Tax=Marinoscillum furvescens DSM 4134 TaxID=1122208 RepID=A0A3D9L6E4_MARFU|nr:TonB-dependent receptor [Marinoscillum furvescens]REE00470.1 TonB-dependent receptor [Marinoscillum furvescens DSM 4134]
MKKLLLLTLILSSLVFVAKAQNTLKGRVLDENGLGLPGATIQLADLENTGTVSDADGYYLLSNVPEGTHQLKVSFIGYGPVTRPVTLNQEITSVELTMQPGVVLEEGVLVLGDRLKGQAKALNQQRTNQNITNVVAADQIGRFPDANIGDAMKRIPGITMQGDQGEARNIVIRGLAPQLNSVMINGNRIPSAEGDNRNIQMDLIPADMIQTIEVNKAITPDMDADAIGGSVNLVTRSNPSGERISATLASGYNALSEKPIWTGGLIYGNRFFNDRLGAVVNVSYNDHKFGSDNIEAEWTEGDEVDAYIEEFQIRTYEVQRTRRSASINLDYKLNDRHSVFFNSMYNWRDDWENRYVLVLADIEEPDANGVSFVPTLERETKGGLGSNRIDNRRLEDQRVRTFSVGGNHLLGNASLTWMGAWSQASEKRPNERYAVFVAEPEIEVDGEDEPQGMLFYQDLSNPRKPKFTVAPASGSALSGNDPQIQSLELFELDELTEEHQFTQETDINGRIDLKIPIPKKGYIKVGTRLRHKEKERDNQFYEYSFFNDEFETLNSVPLLQKTDDNFLPGDYAAGSYASNKWLGGLDLTNTARFEEEDKPDEYLAENYTAQESIIAGYVMSEYALSPSLTATAGVRLEATSLKYTGNEVENEEDFVQSISNSDSYVNLLPGVHFKYDANENLIVRAAWTNSLARPNYFDLVPYVDNRVEDEELFLGNPELQPTTSMNFDLMVENYYKSVGLISAGYFHKQVDGFIYTSYSENNDGFEVYQPKNGGTGTIHGVEASVQRQLDFLPGALKGLGVYINYTYTSSTADGVANEDGELRDDLGLPGTAKHLFNTSLSFENKNLIVRASLNYSGDYVDEVGGEAFSDRYYDKQMFLDVNASYAFTKNWRVFAEANNLTNQPLRYYQGSRDRTMQLEYYNMRFNAGLKFDLFN